MLSELTLPPDEIAIPNIDKQTTTKWISWNYMKPEAIPASSSYGERRDVGQQNAELASTLTAFHNKLMS